MIRRFLLALAGIVLLGAATARADWTMKVHHGGTADEFPSPRSTASRFRRAGPLLVPAGVFTMGDGVSYCGVDEPEVTLTRAFHLGQYEVTNLEFRDAVQWAYDHGYAQAVADSIYDNMDGSSVELVDLAGPYCQVSFAGGVFTIDPGKENYPMVEVSWYGGAVLRLIAADRSPRAYDHSTWSATAGPVRSQCLSDGCGGSTLPSSTTSGSAWGTRRHLRSGGL
jgi:hypothetical protein